MHPFWVLVVLCMYAAWLLVLVARVSARGRFWLGSGPHAMATHTTVPCRDIHRQGLHVIMFVPFKRMQGGVDITIAPYSELSHIGFLSNRYRDCLRCIARP